MLGPLLTMSAAAMFIGASVTAAEASSVTTTVAVSGPLNIRTDASTRSAVAGQMKNGATVTLVCKVAGENVRGKLRTTNQWDRMSNGRYVSHGYVRGANSLPTCPAPPPAAPAVVAAGPNGTMTPAQFVAASVAPAQQGQREFKVPASVTIAQAILESGWGKSGLTRNDRNFFGIKCFNGVFAPIANGCHSYATVECTPLPNSVCTPTTATFRTYASATDSFRDHGRFLVGNRRYLPAFAYTNNADQFLYQIWKAGYATSPTYVQNVGALMKQFNLYQYDLR
jgi:flagellar protein FlgJ